MKNLIGRIIPLLTVICIFFFMFIPAAAAETPDEIVFNLTEADDLYYNFGYDGVINSGLYHIYAYGYENGNVVTYDFGEINIVLTEFEPGAGFYIYGPVSMKCDAFYTAFLVATDGSQSVVGFDFSEQNIDSSQFDFTHVVFEPLKAEPISYKDYISNIKVDGNNQLITLSFPREWNYMMIYGHETGSVYAEGAYYVGVTFADDGSDDGYPEQIVFYCDPFGSHFSYYQSQDYYGRYLELSNIPDDATYSITFSFWGFSEDNVEFNPNSSRYVYGAISNNVITPTRHEIWPENSGYAHTLTYTGTFDKSSPGWAPGFQIPFSNLDGQHYGFQVKEFVVTMSIASAYAEWSESQETRELLDEVIRQLEEQGTTLDSILGEEVKQTTWLEKIWNAILSLPSQIGEFFSNALGGIGDAVENIWSGGDVGDDLNDAGDVLGDKNEELGGVVGDLEDSSDALPDMPDDIQNVISGNIGDSFDSDISGLMPWNDDNYSAFWTAMFTPTLASVSVALLLYFVFGKAA